MRENRGKAKQYTTVNGRTIVVKDAYVYSNKGWLHCIETGYRMLTVESQDSRLLIRPNSWRILCGIRILWNLDSGSYITFRDLC